MTEPIVAGSGSSGTTPEAYWVAEVTKITTIARSILKQVTEAQNIYDGNDLETVIAGLAPGEALPGTTVSKEQAEAWAAMVAMVKGFMDQEIVEGSEFTVRKGLYKTWPVVEEVV